MGKAWKFFCLSAATAAAAVGCTTAAAADGVDCVGAGDEAEEVASPALGVDSGSAAAVSDAAAAAAAVSSSAGAGAGAGAAKASISMIYNLCSVCSVNNMCSILGLVVGIKAMTWLTSKGEGRQRFHFVLLWRARLAFARPSLPHLLLLLLASCYQNVLMVHTISTTKDLFDIDRHQAHAIEASSKCCHPK